MDSFLNDLGGKLKKASSAAGPKLSEMSRSLTDGVNSLMSPGAPGGGDLFEEDEAVGAAVAAVDALRAAMRGLLSDVRSYRKDLLAASRAQQRLGERVSTSAEGLQALYERYLPEERVMAQLALSASEVTQSTLCGQFATEFGEPLERLAVAFEDKYGRDVAGLKRRYAAAKGEYQRHKRAAAAATDEGKRYDHLAQAEAVAPEWRSVSGPLLELCERVSERTIKRLNDILVGLATFRAESMVKAQAAAEHAGQAAAAFRDAAPPTPAEPTAPRDQVD